MGRESEIRGPSLSTLAGSWLLQASVLLICVIAYKAGGASWLESPWRYVLVAAALALLAGAGIIVRDWLVREDRRRVTLAAGLSIVSTLLLIGVAEVGLRIVLAANPAVSSAFPRGFLPRDWNERAAINAALLTDQQRNVASGGGMLQFDADLGWTVGASQASVNGLYFSSVEGLRSATQGERLAGREVERRIALVGDSYTFGLGVSFADTWGNRLQQLAGDDTEVLNFGVAGYGVGQAYLRYEKDAQSWEADVVILGVITHDLFRSRTVYPFIAFPHWEFPFPKPRFAATADSLRPANVPLMQPERLFEQRAISELPSIDLEPAYYAPDWTARWYHNFYTVRTLISLSPKWPEPDADYRDEVISLNAGILSLFEESVRGADSRPLVVFFPSFGAGEVGTTIDRGAGRNAGLMHRTLEQAGVPYLDLGPCLGDLPPAEGLAPDGQHYSPAANAMVARCLHDHLRDSDLLR